MQPGPGNQGRTVRIVGLDGLRGLAALLVLVHHTMLLSPSLVAAYTDPRGADLDGAAWLFTFTPLHLLWDGPVAVFVFFVLSGFVLMLPMRRKPRRWSSYYPARIIRLYLPVWGAVVFALLCEMFVPHLQDGSSWVQGHQAPTTGGVTRDLLLIAGAPGATNSALWSLRWEALFSLLLPGFVAFALLLRRFVMLKFLGLCLMIVLGARFGPVDSAFGLTYAFQLPIFAIGCLIAVEWDGIRGWVVRTFRTRLAIGAAGVLAAALLYSYWFVCAVTSASDPVWLLSFTRLLQVLGAAIILVLCASIPAWGRALDAPVVRWLGTRSFSLYLVHEPVVIAAGRLLPVTVFPIVSLLVTVPVSLVLTEAFFRLVERPSHRLSRATAKSVQRIEQRHLAKRER